MHNFKHRIAMGCTAALAVAMFTGCQSIRWSHHNGERSAAQYANDQRITSQVKEDLENSPVYKFPEVTVKTYDGVVQLSGFAKTNQQKQQAGQLAQEVYGVRKVDNAISLISPQTPTPTGREYHAPIVGFPGQTSTNNAAQTPPQQNPNTSQHPNQNQTNQ